MARELTAKQAAYIFFYKNAGYSYDPKTQTLKQGRAAGARKLAKAESDAKSFGYTFEWHLDSDSCVGCDCGDQECDCFTGTQHETLGCVMYGPDGDAVESLWGICKATKEYRRVVEAELALEQF